jgi:hypothetical protein
MSSNERYTPMVSATGDIPVVRVEVPEHFASEEDATHLYRPKGMQYETSMQQTRFVLPNDVYGPVRNLAVVCLTTSADHIERKRCWQQLHRMRDAGDEMAAAVLEALQGFKLSE